MEVEGKVAEVSGEARGFGDGRACKLDVAYARAAFPALRGATAYMDNAGGSLTLGSVAERVRDYLTGADVQLGASYAASVAAAELCAQARASLGDLVGARRPEEVVLGPSTTVLLRFLADAMVSLMRPGDEVVVTNVDHEANVGCWRRLEVAGARLREWRRNPDTGGLELDDLDGVLGPRTRLVSVGHVSNSLGAIHPIEEIARRVRAAGAWLCVDGVAYAPHRAVDVRALDVDFYAVSMYKVFGPHIALLYARREPFMELGSVNHFFIGQDKFPGKLEPGNASYELAWGAGAVPEYLESLGGRCGAPEHLEPHGGRYAAAGRRPGVELRSAAWAAIADHEAALAERLLSYLLSRHDVRIVGPETADAAVRVPTISFVHDTLPAPRVVETIDKHDIGVRHGHFYAYRLIEDLGLHARGGVVRVSLAHYNTLEEVDRLIRALELALARD